MFSANDNQEEARLLLMIIQFDRYDI